MDRRLALVPLLGAAALAFACSPHPRIGGERAGPQVARPVRPSAAQRAPGDTGIAASLALAPEADDEGLRFALAVSNATRHRVELAFPDGRTREFVVYDAAGREVWRSSAGRLFTQTMQTKLVGVGDSVVYAERWATPRPGRYTLVAELRSENYPVVRRLDFVVPDGATGATTPTRLASH